MMQTAPLVDVKGIGVAPEELEAFVDMAIRLRVALDRAWDRLPALPPLDLATYCTRTKANLVHDYWVELIEAEFANDMNVRPMNDRGLRYLSGPRYRVRFKKLNRRGLASGNRTRRAAEWIQLPIPSVDPVLSLNFGYRPDCLWTKIEVAGLSLQVGDTVRYFLEVRTLQEADEPDGKENGEPILRLRDGRVRVKRVVLETRQAAMFDGSNDAPRSGTES